MSQLLFMLSAFEIFFWEFLHDPFFWNHARSGIMCKKIVA